MYSRVYTSAHHWSVTHRKMEQIEEAAADCLWRGLQQGKICRLAIPEGLGPMLRQLAGCILISPCLCVLLACGDCDICPQGYELLRCKQSQALMSVLCCSSSQGPFGHFIS